MLPDAVLRERAGVIDIATAQWKFDRLGKLSRLYLRLAPGATPQQVRERLSSILPPGVRIVTPGEAADEATRLSSAYRSNLMALALVALFTGGFFVYSTQSLATLRRRRELALLHALGVTRRQQFTFTLYGAAMVGAAGALAGVAAGIAIARMGLSVLGSDLGGGFFRDLTPSLQLRWYEMAAFSSAGNAGRNGGTLSIRDWKQREFPPLQR